MHTERLEFLSKCFLVVCCVMCLNRFKVVFFITQTQTHTRDKKKKKKSRMRTGLHTNILHIQTGI